MQAALLQVAQQAVGNSAASTEVPADHAHPGVPSKGHTLEFRVTPDNGSVRDVCQLLLLLPAAADGPGTAFQKAVEWLLEQLSRRRAPSLTSLGRLPLQACIHVPGCSLQHPRQGQDPCSHLWLHCWLHAGEQSDKLRSN